MVIWGKPWREPNQWSPSTTVQVRPLIRVNGVEDSDLPGNFSSFFLSFWKVFFFLLQTFSNLRDCRVCQGNIFAPQECVTALIKKTNFNTAAGPHAGHRETLFQPAQQGFKPNVFGVFFPNFCWPLPTSLNLKNIWCLISYSLFQTPKTWRNQMVLWLFHLRHTDEIL